MEPKDTFTRAPPLVLNLSQMNPVYTLPFYFFKIHFIIVTDLIRALPGNGSVNSPTYMGGQQHSGVVL
jgi:hypothetical protein